MNYCVNIVDAESHRRVLEIALGVEVGCGLRRIAERAS